MTTASVLRGTTFDSRAFAPYLVGTIPDQSMNVFTVVALNLAFYLKGGTGTTYSMTNIPTGLTLNASTGLLSGTVTTGQTLSCVATATNTLGAASDTLSWIVTQTLTWAALPSPLNVPQNSFFDLAPYISGGTPTNITDAVALPTNVSISMPPNSPTPRLVASSAATVGAFTDNNVFTMTSGSTALADWNTRVYGNTAGTGNGAAGVLWAHRFTNATEVARWSGGLTSGSWDRAAVATKIKYNAADGIIGDGCMEHAYNVGDSNFYRWDRPMMPIVGDINQPGLPTATAYTDWLSAVNNHNKGFFAHPSYLPTWPSPYIIGDEYWFQYRIKFSASSFQDSTAKVMWHNINYVNTNGQFFYDMETNYHAGVLDKSYGPGFWVGYTNFGSAWNSVLSNPQDSPSINNLQLQVGGPFAASCVSTGSNVIGYPTTTACWLFPQDQWVTLMFHFKGGPHVVKDPAHPTARDAIYDGQRTTTFEMFAWKPGDTPGQWTRVWGKINTNNNDGWVWDYAVDPAGPYLSVPNGVPLGNNWIQFSSFNGGGAATPVFRPEGIYRRFDQMIFSTQPIACPLL